MSTSRSIEKLYIAGAVASILAFLGTLPISGVPFLSDDDADRPSASVSQSQVSQRDLELTGHLGTDVEKALIRKGAVQGTFGEIGRRDLTQAIKQAESRLGLPADGVPDKSLLGRLKAELDREQPGGDADIGTSRGEGNDLLFGRTIESWSGIVQILSVLSGILMSWLAFFRSRPEQAA